MSFRVKLGKKFENVEKEKTIAEAGFEPTPSRL